MWQGYIAQDDRQHFHTITIGSSVEGHTVDEKNGLKQVNLQRFIENFVSGPLYRILGETDEWG